MKIATLSDERLAALIGRFHDARIAVVGDFFLDWYLLVDPARQETSVETGKPAHQVVEKRTAPGAAGTVMRNLAALRAGRLIAIGYIGDDGEGHELHRDLAALGVETARLIREPRRMTPTYLKPRDRDDPTLAGEHSRYDTKNHTPTPEAMVERIIGDIEAVLPDVDAVVAMDQVEEAECGVVTSRVREALAGLAERWPDVVFWADSRRFIDRFRRVIVKPNQHEAAGVKPTLDAAGRERPVELETLREAAAAMGRTNRAPVVVTRGAGGLLVCPTDGEPTLAPGVPVDGEIDPTGAGDSATAGAVLALCGGASLAEAGVVANLVASITVQQIGDTGAADPTRLPAQLSRYHEAAARAEATSD